MHDLNAHALAYYVQAEPTISDFEYDQLYRQCQAMEAQHPDWCVSYSPTQRVGAPVPSDAPQIKHAVPMLSLDNAFEPSEVRAFAERCIKRLGYEPSWVVEPKYDGVAVSVHYKHGVFDYAVSRGDGQSGEDISHAIKTIRNLPLI